MSQSIGYLIEKLKEPSTWKGIIWIVTAFGVVSLQPEQKEAVAAFGMTLAGLIGVFLEKGNAHTKEEIAKIAKDEQEKNVEKILKANKNEETKKSNESSDDADFFGDSDGGDGGE